MAIPGSGLGQDLWLIGMTLFIVSSLLGGLNYIVTILNLRTKGMSMTRLRFGNVEAVYCAILGVLSFPVLLSASLLLVFDRTFGTSFYLSDIVIVGESFHHTGVLLFCLNIFFGFWVIQRYILFYCPNFRNSFRGDISEFAKTYIWI